MCNRCFFIIKSMINYSLLLGPNIILPQLVILGRQPEHLWTSEYTTEIMNRDFEIQIIISHIPTLECISLLIEIQ